MKLFFLSILLTSFSVSAGLERMSLQNLDLEYQVPAGKGTADKIGIGASLDAIDFVIHRTDHSFDITLPYMNFSWINPLRFFYNLDTLMVQKGNADFGGKNHTLDSELIQFRPHGRGEYKAEVVKGSCMGTATGSLDVRLLEDCRSHMELVIKKLDVPSDFILYQILENLPSLPMPEMDLPGEHLILKSDQGNFSLQIYIKYWFYAGLRSWGHVQYENNHQTVAIRVDKIKFGYLSVTDLVMNKLKDLIKNPNVKVDPPWIRIDIGSIDENQ